MNRAYFEKWRPMLLAALLLCFAAAVEGWRDIIPRARLAAPASSFVAALALAAGAALEHPSLALAASAESAPEPQQSVVASSSEAATFPAAITSPVAAVVPAPSWLVQFQDALQQHAERQIAENQLIERQRVAFESEMDGKRREFELDLERQRKQFEMDLKSAADKRASEEGRNGDLKYYVSLAVTLGLFGLDQFVLKKRDAKNDEAATPPVSKKERRDSFLD